MDNRVSTRTCMGHEGGSFVLRVILEEIGNGGPVCCNVLDSFFRLCMFHVSFASPEPFTVVVLKSCEGLPLRGYRCEARREVEKRHSGLRTRNADGESVCDAAGGCRGAAFVAGVLCAEEAFGG
jgi:hypothetical protein